MLKRAQFRRRGVVAAAAVAASVVVSTAIFSTTWLAGTSAARAEKIVTFKIATLAPEGSTWWKILNNADARMKELSGGQMRMKLYAGGVAGDEPDFVRKMRVGQLQGAAVTSVGLAELQPALLALQAPGLFASWEELDATRAKLGSRLAGLLKEKGYVVLTWGDVGFNQVFSNKLVKTPADLNGTKPWCWTQDGVYQAFFTAAGVKAVPLGVPEVLPGLQTGLVDALSSAPLAVLSLQWFSRMKYVLDLPISVNIGAVLVTEKSFAELTDAQRAILMQVGGEIGPTLAASVRDENRRAIDAMRTAGMQVTQADAAAKAAWADLAIRTQDAAAGKVYPRELLEDIRKAVKESHAKTGG